MVLVFVNRFHLEVVEIHAAYLCSSNKDKMWRAQPYQSSFRFPKVKPAANRLRKCVAHMNNAIPYPLPALPLYDESKTRNANACKYGPECKANKALILLHPNPLISHRPLHHLLLFAQVSSQIHSRTSMSHLLRR